MRFTKSLMLALLIASTLSVTSGYGSSPPGTVSKIEKEYIEPTTTSASGLVIELKATVYDAPVISETRIVSVPVPNVTVQTESIPAATYGYAIDKRVNNATTIYKNDDPGPRNLLYLHIDPGLNLNQCYNI